MYQGQGHRSTLISWGPLEHCSWSQDLSSIIIPSFNGIAHIIGFTTLWALYHKYPGQGTVFGITSNTKILQQVKMNSPKWKVQIRNPKTITANALHCINNHENSNGELDADETIKLIRN